MKLFYFCIFALFGYLGLYGAEKDTIKTYRLGEIIAIGKKEKATLHPAVIHTIPYHELQQTDAASVSQLGIYIPSGRIQTNSRGESLIYLRGSGERQVSVFLDGAPLNLPWDNRIDLSFIPGDLIGSISVQNAAGSILYGPNILGGAVNIGTVERAYDGVGSSIRFQADNSGRQFLTVTNDSRKGALNYIANLSYLNSPGFLLPDGSGGLINQGENTALRTNTDQERLSAYLRTEYKFSEMTTAGLSVNHVNAEKGVAPEGHRLEKTRFWRYPIWKRALITLNGEHKFSKRDESFLRAALWYDSYEQAIDYYGDISYKDITNTEKLAGSNLGARLSAQAELTKGQFLTGAFTGFMSANDFNSPDEGDYNYYQDTYSAGLEYRGLFGRLAITAGATMDGNISTREGAGGSEDEAILSDFGASAGVKYFANSYLTVYASSLRRTRFPSLREKYSTAGGKFIINPELSTETGILNEAGFQLKYGPFKGDFTVFANYYSDLIGQSSVGDFRKRVNFDEARILGFESVLDFAPTPRLDFRGMFTYLNAKRKTDSGFDGKLEYRPEFTALFSAEYEFLFGLRALAEINITGPQEAENVNTNEWERIGQATLLNLRLAYRFGALNGILPEIFVRANNVFDEYKLSQLGLPEPGRTIIAGLAVKI